MTNHDRRNVGFGVLAATVRFVVSVFVALVIGVAIRPLVGEIESWGIKILVGVGLSLPGALLAQLGISGLLRLLKKRYERIEE